MRTSKWSGTFAALAVIVALGAGVASSDSSAASAKGKPAVANKAYIVTLADQPVTAYTGGIRGYAATKPRKGQKIDPNSPAVVNYLGYLASRQDALLARVGGGRKLYNYGYAFSGFAAELTEAQAQRLAAMPGVLAVTKDEAREAVTSSTPGFLGLAGSGGFWASLGTGENVVIGIVDSGVWPEHPSFSDRTGSNGNYSKDGKLGYQQLPGWHGKCIPGEQFDASNCNQKLIGARYYNAGFGGNAGVDSQLPHEFNSARDHNGHGSHTASTAGGNAGVPATGLTAAYGRISGIAPRARIAVYKSCWSVPGTAGSCFSSDSIAAIDQAVADGVDVVNYSISGSRTNFRDPVEIAFLYAADAGVFVAASAGNSGPTSSTVAHPGPWLTTVAAATHNRATQGGSLTIAGGATYEGLANVTSIGPKTLADAAQSGIAGVDAAQLALCFGAEDGVGGLLDPAKVAGKIVVCERGGNVLVNKAQAVKDAGGVGMVLVNTPSSAQTLPSVSYAIPAVHLPSAVYAPVKAAAAAGAAGTINGAAIVYDAAAPFTASFSSRGPLQASASLIKPDITAPGQDILAAVAPPGNGGKLFDLYSGTSMSSPHVAGLAALFKQARPDWSPMMIKSALMTTAYDVLDTGVSDAARIFRQGAGHVQPVRAADPGLVFDAGFNDWLGFLCGTQLPASFCTTAGVPVIEPFNLNGASIAVGALAGRQTVKRTVTNVGGNPATYNASVSGMAGFEVTVNPPSFTIGAGRTQDLEVTFTRTTAALNTYAAGQLRLNDGIHDVRVPMVTVPVALAAPAQVSGSYEVTFGYDGSFSATPRGLIPADVRTGTVAQDPDQTFDPADGTGTVALTVNVPAGTSYLRLSLFDAEVAAGSDIDVYVYRGATLVGASTNGGSQEEVNLTNPTAATYTVYLHGWGLPSGSSAYRLHAWVLGTADAGNMTVSAPTQAVTGQKGSIGITTSGLAAGTRYLGAVAYGGATGMPSPTIVRIDTP